MSTTDHASAMNDEAASRAVAGGVPDDQMVARVMADDPLQNTMGEALHAPEVPQYTKILCTLGPSTDNEKTLAKMVACGATLFRLNFSHGSFEEHKKRVDLVRGVAKKLKTPLTILGDMPGPKIRVGQVEKPGILLETGQDVLIDPTLEVSVDGSVPKLSATYEGIADEVEGGQRVLINDGHIRMLAVGKEGSALRCRVMVGGLVTSKKGINLPDSSLSVPAVTEYDWKCAMWAIEQELDFLAVSFVRKGEDILKLHARLRAVVNFEKTGTGLTASGSDAMIPLVAKVETPQAVADIESIVQEADAIMVARGDLGVEMDLATLPVTQKRLVRTAHAHGKPCIVATQMLESMIESPTATRAEVSDVANAILDGADAVMLSGETAVGKHPVLAVETMRRVALATEAALRDAEVAAAPPEHLRAKKQLIPALAHGAWHMARDVDAKLIVVWAQHGGAARFLSRNSFNIPIIAFSSDLRAVRRMNILYATFPVHMEYVPQHRSDFARVVDQFALAKGWVKKGDPILLIGGKPLDNAASVNTVAIRYAGDLATT